MQLKLMVGPDATKRFVHLLKEGTPPAIFKAFYDLYLDGTLVRALSIFQNLVEIGQANEQYFIASHLEWAAWQTQHLIRSKIHCIDIWIRDVCDPPKYDFAGDDIFFKKWQAPQLLIMRPSRFRPYVSALNWERLDADRSLSLRRDLSENYVLHLEISLEKLAGHLAIELAKKPQPEHLNLSRIRSHTDAAETDRSIAIARTRIEVCADDSKRSYSVRREASKIETQDKYKSWQKQYRALRKKHPNMSDVWCSQRIARMDIGSGNSAETIRRNMKS
jgi:hypothetical protein